MNQKKKQIKVFPNQDYKELGILYGLFFEDLNHAADGGLYAEMVQNRSFEYCEMDRKEYHALTAWEKAGSIEWEVRTKQPMHMEQRQRQDDTESGESHRRRKGSAVVAGRTGKEQCTSYQPERSWAGRDQFL